MRRWRQVSAAGLVTCITLGSLLVARTAPATARAEAADVRFDVTAKRYEFLPDHIDVTEGDRVTLVVRSEDTAHGIGIKRLGIAEEIPRGGQAVTLTFTAPAPGSYEMKCSEYCGRGHDRMRGTLVVRPRQAGGTRWFGR